MTIAIRYAARSDVGMLREGNEDSAYAGAYLLAVADGMGGHVGGEIASAAAIGELRKLDTDLPANELLPALEHTVKAANDKLHRIVESDPALQGMGTTLTAMLWSGNQVALVHIGDSRAYLLRDGSLFQITHDHTLVQSLVDEGRISPDEAASHPQRSLLLRALDGRGEVDPDLSLREARVGDRYLLCSDGLSSVVTAETIFRVLSEYGDPEQAVRQLIDLANRGGGPDNITCVIADVVEFSQAPAPSSAPLAVGAAANAQRVDVEGGPGGGAAAPADRSADTPAGRAAQLRDTLPQQPVVVDEMPPPAPMPPLQEPQMREARPAPAPRRATRGRVPGRRWTWLILAVVVFVGILGAAVYVGIQGMKGDGYYAVAEGRKVVVYQGEPQSVLGLKMYSRAKSQPTPEILVKDLPQRVQNQLRTKSGVPLRGANGWMNLRDQVCKYVLTEHGERVAVQQGVGQESGGCQVGQPKDQELLIAELPTSTQQDVRDQKFKYANEQQARVKVTELQTIAKQCKDKVNGAPQDCPDPAPGRKGS